MSAQIAYPAHDLRILAALEERHFWFRARRRIIVDALGRWFPRAGTYLEIGCGTGYNTRGIQETFPHWRITASDPLTDDPSCLPIDATDIPFESAFDVIGAYDVLEHIQDDEAALAQFHKASSPGGGVLLTVPQHPWLWSPADEHAQHHRRYTARELVNKLEANGFDVFGKTSFHTLNLPLFYLRSRVLRATGRNREATLPAAPLNWLLGQSMQIDRRLIQAGVRLPFGVSLLVAARRRD